MSLTRAISTAVFAYIVGLSFSVKVSSAARLVEKGKLDRAQFLVAVELTLDLRDGEIVEKPLRASLEESVKLACRLADMAHGKEGPTLDTSRQWWSDFKKATGVRDRLTHPKLPRDVDISPGEVVLIIRVESGFRELMGAVSASRTALRAIEFGHTSRSYNARTRGSDLSIVAANA